MITRLKIKYIENKGLFMISILAFFAIIVLLITMINHFNNDGMEQAGIKKVKYRVYTKEDGWSKWSKNGKISGNRKNEITNIEIKMKDDFSKVDLYQDNEWNISAEKLLNKNINGIRVINSAYFLRKYQVCYRTYNSKNKWLNWTCNGNISGNINESITALEIKIIPKNVIKSEYLKEYIESKNDSSIGF